MNELKDGLKRYFQFYNEERFHASLGYSTPDEMYKSIFKDREPELPSAA